MTRNVVVARARPGVSRVAERLREAGAAVVEAPRIERTRALNMPANLADHVIVASEEAAEFIGEAGAAAFSSTPLVAIGAAARRALEERGITPDIVADGACAASLASLRSAIAGKRVLVPIVEGGRPQLLRDLVELGAHPEALVIAHERRMPPATWPAPVDLVVLPASSAATALYECAPASLRERPAVAMGPLTAEAARRHGVRAVFIADHDTPDALVAAALRVLHAEAAE